MDAIDVYLIALCYGERQVTKDEFRNAVRQVLKEDAERSVKEMQASRAKSNQ